MYREGNRLVLSPTDLVGYLACAHLSELSLEVADGRRARPEGTDPELALVQAYGMAHEKAHLADLVAQGLSVVEIPGEGDLEARVAATLDALRSGVDVVYQATFVHDDADGYRWRGHADFLRKVPTPTELGPFGYEPFDTKLARRVKAAAIVQLCEYAEQLGRVQGRPPDRIHVLLGDGRPVAIGLDGVAAYHRAAKARFVAALPTLAAYPLPNEHCGICVWRDQCDARRAADDHLTLVAGLRVDHCRRLEAAGIATMTQLAASAEVAVDHVASATMDRLVRQAQLQVEAGRHPGSPPPYELLEPAVPGIGLGALPEPSPGDLFFDIEADPYLYGDGLEYLLGVGWWDEAGEFAYRPFWAHSRGEEKIAFEQFVDFVGQRLAERPDLHVYHYAPYERTALGRLMGRHGTREAEIDRLLRGGVLVDLLRVVRQSARVGTPSRSLKKIEALYMAPRTEAVTDAGSSIVEYERWLDGGDPRILDQLAEYNRVDCHSTALLRQWLEERRGEYEERFGTAPPRPIASEPEAPEAVAAESEANAARRIALASPGVADDDAGRAAAHLLGDLLEWHRREDKPEYWRYFQRVFECDDEALFDDTEAIAGLVHTGTEPDGHSERHRYRFDPGQEHKLAAGSPVVDPETVRAGRNGGPRLPGPGRLVDLDPALGTLVLRRKVGSAAPHPRALIPAGPVDTAPLRRALQRVADAVVDSGIDGPGSYRAVRDLLLRRPPRTAPATTGPLIGTGDDADPASAVARLAGRLDGGYLAVQGPPGSGKTRTAAAVVVDLVDAGRSVGLTAPSHAVVSHLLAGVLEEAARRGVALTASQKGDDDQTVDHPQVCRRRGNDEIVADLAAGTKVVAGTAWLFASAALDGALDHLVIDEAGQMSLANAVAAGTAAHNLVLVGDPQQLAQPSKGVHPEGAWVSSLEHVLDGADTMPAELGVFLDRTHRLHPEICRFVSELSYDGRLRSRPGCEEQHLGGDGPLSGSGLRWAPVDHAGNRTSSLEEAEVVARLYRELVGRPSTDAGGREWRLDADDVLVVAPYNAQVSLLSATLGPAARVGTVDKFQGQEAAVVLVSLATSSLTEIPRGMDFLYSRNRLNVAVSRARALVVLVASQSLLAVRCHTVDQLRLANGLCRYVELAGPAGS